MRLSKLLRGILPVAGSLLLGASIAPAASIEYIGKASIPGTAIDKSGLPGDFGPGTALQQQLGAFGSGLTYTGVGNLYVAVPDRGPSDGTTGWIDRMEWFEINVKLTPTPSVTAVNTATTLLTNENGQQFTGLLTAFDATNSPASLRLDPESIRRGPNHTLFISDEYGPYIYQFNSLGQRIATIPVPDKFNIAHPDADPNAELSNNTSGRQANRGMEGLAITPDGSKLVGIMQNALIQDNAMDASLKRIGLFNRILVKDLATNETHEYVYQLDKPSLGVNEIVAVNDHEFLVIERDGSAGNKAAVKKIYKIDLTGATDVKNVASLPEKTLPADITPVSKTLFIDLLDSTYGLQGADFPEKIEGLTWGPDLPNGRHLLLVTNDNDLITTNPSNFYAFSIDPTSINYQPETTPATVPLPAAVWAGGAMLSALAALGVRRAK